MRWKVKEKKENPSPGDTRIVRKFLYLPKRLGEEKRWWEYADIEQVLRRVTSLNPDMDVKVDKWVDKEWADE